VPVEWQFDVKGSGQDGFGCGAKTKRDSFASHLHKGLHHQAHQLLTPFVNAVEATPLTAGGGVGVTQNQAPLCTSHFVNLNKIEKKKNSGFLIATSYFY